MATVIAIPSPEDFKDIPCPPLKESLREKARVALAELDTLPPKTQRHGIRALFEEFHDLFYGGGSAKFFHPELNEFWEKAVEFSVPAKAKCRRATLFRHVEDRYMQLNTFLHKDHVAAKDVALARRFISNMV